MARVSVNEKTAFNCTEDDLPFYIDCLHRKIQKSSPQPIYHYHEKIELLYCIKGELEVTLFSHPVILKKGDCLYLAPNTPHATSAASNSNEHICVKFLSSVIHVPSSRRIPPENYYISLTPDHKLFKADEDNSELFRKLFFSCIENFSHDDYFKPSLKRGDETALPVRLRWGGAEDSDGIEIPISIKAQPHFCELKFADNNNFMLEFNGMWFYKSPEAGFIDLMPAFYARPFSGECEIPLRIFAPPASGENDLSVPDGLLNYFCIIKKLPELRIEYGPVEPSKDKNGE